jgi:nucleotide-binding universal stress UspA family protein
VTILCATDFSRPASDALAVAVELAKKRKESLLLWHAVQPYVGDAGLPFVEPMRADCAAQLEREADRIRATGLTVTTETVVGWPDDELPARMPSDTTFIVAGARGHARGTHWLIGTVVERLARVTTVPLLVVRDAGALHEWLARNRRLHVLMATDLSAVSDFALRRSLVLRELGACDFELLYVEYPPAEHARLGIAGPVVVHRPHPLVEDVLTSELERRAATMQAEGETATRITRTLGQTGSLIALEAAETHASLVVVGSHQRKALSRIWQGSIAHGVLHSAETNVLLIPFHTADEEVRALEPPQLRTIVAATDLSPGGNRAVAWANTLARPDTQLVLVTVVRSAHETEEASRELERVKAALVRKSVNTVVTVGKDPAAVICTTAERFGADAIVIGRHGASRVAQLFFGSVAADLLQRSRRPVLVVPDPAVF